MHTLSRPYFSISRVRNQGPTVIELVWNTFLTYVIRLTVVDHRLLNGVQQLFEEWMTRYGSDQAVRNSVELVRDWIKRFLFQAVRPLDAMVPNLCHIYAAISVQNFPARHTRTEPKEILRVMRFGGIVDALVLHPTFEHSGHPAVMLPTGMQPFPFLTHLEKTRALDLHRAKCDAG